MSVGQRLFIAHVRLIVCSLFRVSRNIRGQEGARRSRGFSETRCASTIVDDDERMIHMGR